MPQIIVTADQGQEQDGIMLRERGTPPTSRASGLPPT